MFAGDLLAERARVTPDRTALVSVETGERLTYAELSARTDGAANAIRAAGIVRGDRFGLLAHNCVDYIAFFFAAGRVGAIVVPLSTRATPHELAAIARDCAMKALFVGAGFEPLTRLRHPLPADAGRGVSNAEDLLPTTRGEGARSADEGLDVPAFPLTCRAEAPTAPPVEGDGEDIYCLLYTSGTTGKPKGVMIPRRQLWWNGYNTAVNWGLREDDVSPLFTPLYHAGGLAAFLIPIFTVGGTMVLHKSFDPATVWQTISRERCTVVLGVPTIWKLLLDAPELQGLDLSHVRWFISGGAPLPAYLIDAYAARGIVMKQGFGLTEVGVNCFTTTVEEAVRKRGSIGRPLLFTEARLVDGEEREVNNGEIGELHLRGPHVSLGYWNNEEATRAAYSSDGWFRTGDLARRDDDGFFYIAGRRKEMFISGGVNVYPAEIEAELVAHPSVTDAAVVPIADETWGEVGIAFVVGAVSETELCDYLALRIARYKLPRRYVFLDALPRTPYGKVEKARLRDTLVDER